MEARASEEFRPNRFHRLADQIFWKPSDFPYVPNRPSDPQEVLRFTRWYGPLEQSWCVNGGFRFSFNAWQRLQEGFRREWEHFLQTLNNHTVVGFFPGPDGVRGWEYDPAVGLRYRTANLWEYLHLSLMACPKEGPKKCARPECPPPYFVAPSFETELLF